MKMRDGVKPPLPRSTLRADQVRETRRRIREAAQGLFLERGFTATSMDDVARTAGVSRQTVFSRFGSKGGLLKEVVDVAMAGDDAPVPLTERPAARDIAAETDLTHAVRRHAALVAEVAFRVAPVYEVLMQAAATDAECADLLRTYDQGRLEGIGSIVDVVAAQGALRHDRTPQQIKEGIWLVTGPDAYLRARDCGWSRTDYERWIGDVMAALVLG